MKKLSAAAAILGLAAIVALVAYFGAGAVIRAMAAVGGLGFITICAIHLVLIGVMGLAWRALLPGTSVWVALWGRLVRDSTGELLPFLQVGGYVIGARAVTLAGVSGTLATASTIVDITLEFASQLAYTALGLAWLIHLQPDSAAAIPAMIGLPVAVLAAAGFVLTQRHGFRHFERVARIIGSGWAERTAAGAAALHSALTGIYQRSGGLWASFGLHLFCWIATSVETWLALHLAGEGLSFGAVLALESMLYAVRTAAFIVPNGMGVQEGAYVVLGAGFGLTPEMALALSLLKRARDIAIGIPVISAWQAVEGGRLWRRRDVTAAEPMATPPEVS